MDTKKLVIAVCVLLAYVFLSFYLTTSKEFKIVQLSLAELTPSILMKKNPIVIEERLVNPLSLLQTVFKFMYVYKSVKAVEYDKGDGLFRQNRGRFMILCSKVDDNSIHLVNPRFKNETGDDYVDIKLHANMCLVVPNKWYYRLSMPKDTMSIVLEDIVSLTLGRL